MNFWLIVRTKEQHEYIFITAIEIRNFYSRVILEAKQFFGPKMLIYAN